MGFSKQEFNEEKEELVDVEEDNDTEMSDEEMALELEDDFANLVNVFDNE